MFDEFSAWTNIAAGWYLALVAGGLSYYLFPHYAPIIVIVMVLLPIAINWVHQVFYADRH